MNQERDLARMHIAPSATTRDDDLAPGRGRRSSQLDAPAYPIASGLIQRKSRDANGIADGTDATISAASSTGSSALPEVVKRKFESSLGIDLSSVRIHTSSESQTAAESVGAKAYTIGQDIHFAVGQYDPSSGAGQHLLAHEVAHTVQQAGGAPSTQYKLEVSSPGDAAEAEADRAADAMVSGAPAAIMSGTARKIARKVGDDNWWKQVLVQYAAFLKGNNGDQTKALAALKAQLGGAYPGDAVVLARAGAGASKTEAPLSAEALADPDNDDNRCDLAAQKSDANQSNSDDGGQCVDPNAGGGEGEKEVKESSEGENEEGETGGGVEVTPLTVGGIGLGLKAGTEGVEIEVAKEIEVPVPEVPICPLVFLTFVPKIAVSGTVKWSQEAGWDGTLGLGFSFEAHINGGVPWAHIYAGGTLTLNLNPHVAKNGFGELSGDLEGTLEIGAELNVPFNEGAKMADPEGWKSSGGVKFDAVLAQSKFLHITISGDGFNCTWIGPDLSSRGSALQTWKEEYNRNIAGGGAEGALPAYPTDPSDSNDGAGGSHG